MRIGILRCLLYYPFYPFWKAFFSRLGFDLVLSPPMTSEMFDRGSRRFVGDICLPIESAFGHIESIRKEVDLIFIPRTNELHRDVYVCPACAGLPYVVQQSMPDIPGLLSLRLTPFRFLNRDDVKKLKALGVKKREIREAFSHAENQYRAFIEQARGEPCLATAIDRATGQSPASSRPKSDGGPHVLLLGMPYVLGDSFVNQGIPSMFADRGVRCSTPHMMVPELANQEILTEGYWIYWTFGGMSIATLTRSFEVGKVDGVVYCSSFACGVDSLITPIVQSACSRRFQVPFLLLVVDEHAESSHLEVRVEAFLDCLREGVYTRRSIL